MRRTACCNEKYMGDVLLQKTYTVDFLTKKKKKNTGELTQYYVTDNHPAIINREVFLQVQAELARRAGKKKASKKRSKSALGKYCSKYSLSERLVCGECGSMYRRVIWTRKDGKKPMWRCINRLEFGAQYCKHSPSLPEGPLHQAILTCIQKVAGKREDILQNLRDVRNNLLAFPDTPANSVSLQQQIDQLTGTLTAPVICPLLAPQVNNAVLSPQTNQRIAAAPALDFSGQPGIMAFSAILECSVL